MPLRAGEIIKICGAHGCVCKTNKGSHAKIRNRDGKHFTLAMKNGPKTEISDIYIRQLARQLGIPVEAFLAAKGKKK
jgi:predicted RNA binding protein YcfA (HicA-like mRNA interferase family)